MYHFEDWEAAIDDRQILKCNIVIFFYISMHLPNLSVALVLICKTRELSIVDTL